MLKGGAPEAEEAGDGAPPLVEERPEAEEAGLASRERPTETCPPSELPSAPAVKSFVSLDCVWFPSGRLSLSECCAELVRSVLAIDASRDAEERVCARVSGGKSVIKTGPATEYTGDRRPSRRRRPQDELGVAEASRCWLDQDKSKAKLILQSQLHGNARASNAIGLLLFNCIPCHTLVPPHQVQIATRLVVFRADADVSFDLPTSQQKQRPWRLTRSCMTYPPPDLLPVDSILAPMPVSRGPSRIWTRVDTRIRGTLTRSCHAHTPSRGISYMCLPSNDNDAWYYPSYGFEPNEEGLPAPPFRGNWGMKTFNEAKWVRRGKMAAWGPWVEDWEVRLLVVVHSAIITHYRQRTGRGSVSASCCNRKKMTSRY